MKPTLNEEIEISTKGIDYVNSLVPKTETIDTNDIPIDGGLSIKQQQKQAK